MMTCSPGRTCFVGRAEEHLLDEVLGGVALGGRRDEHLHLRDRLLVGEVLVEPVGGQDQEPVPRAQLVVEKGGVARDVRRRPDVVDSEHLQQRVVPFRLSKKQQPPSAQHKGEMIFIWSKACH